MSDATCVAEWVAYHYVVGQLGAGLPTSRFLSDTLRNEFADGRGVDDSGASQARFSPPILTATVVVAGDQLGPRVELAVTFERVGQRGELSFILLDLTLLNTAESWKVAVLRSTES